VSSRKEQKERARQERLAKEEQRRREARRQRTRIVAAGVLAAAVVAAGLLIVRPWNGEPATSFAYASDGAAERVAGAGLTAGDGPHIHPKLNVVVRDQPIAVPADIGIGAAHLPMHTHETDGTIHVEGAAGKPTIGQFMALWGVEFGRDRLGPYRSSGRERVRMWVKAPDKQSFREIPADASLKLTDRQELYVFFGPPSQAPVT
jgi:hypothetical protein